jgi:hypothetical protein
MFIVDKEYNYLDSDSNYLTPKNPINRFVELTESSPVIVDLNFIENTKFNEIKPKNKSYIYCVSEELNVGKWVMNPNSKYPNVVFANNYKDILTHFSFRFPNTMIFVFGMQSLIDLRYLISRIEFSVINKIYKESNSQFPIDDCIEFLNYNIDTLKVFNYKISEIQEVEKPLIEKTVLGTFSDYIRFAKEQQKILDAEELENESTLFNIQRMYRSLVHINTYNLKVRFAKKYEINHQNHKIIPLTDKMFCLLEITNKINLVRKIYNIDDLGIEKLSDVYKIENLKTIIPTITTSTISDYCNDYENSYISEADLKKLILKNKIQIQQR